MTNKEWVDLQEVIPRNVEAVLPHLDDAIAAIEQRLPNGGEDLMVLARFAMLVAFTMQNLHERWEIKLQSATPI